MIPHSRPSLSHQEIDAIARAVASGWVGGRGPEGERLGVEVAQILGQASGRAVSSGTAGLEVCLRVVGVTGRQVAVPALACLSIERAVRRAGAEPLLVDVNDADLSFPPGALGECAAAGCVAAVLVHQFGVPAAAADEVVDAPLPVIEDVTTAVGGARRGRSLGSFGRLAVASFGATKLACGGEGGAVAGSPDDVALATAWIDPESDLPETEPVGNAKMADINAALARVQLARLPEMLARRASIAARYDEVVADAGARGWRPADGDTGTWWRYLIEVSPDRADPVVDDARRIGVALARPVARRSWSGRGCFPVAERLQRSLVSVPIYPDLSDDEVERVVAALQGALRVAA